MSDDSFINDLATPHRWISGRYVLPEATLPAFVVATCSPELVDVTTYVFVADLHSNRQTFEPNLRYIWPVSADDIFVYAAEGPGGLNLYETLEAEVFEDFGFGDLVDGREVADILCPLMEPLEVFDAELHHFEDSVSDLDALEGIWGKLEGREAPDFWKSSRKKK